MKIDMPKWERASNYMGDDLSDCYMVIGHSRDSGLVAESNWEVALDRLFEKTDDGAVIETDDIFIGRFGHWALGWIEGVLVRETADEETLDKCNELYLSLMRYAVLDDDHFCQKESAYAQELWEDLSIEERVGLCQDVKISIFAARSERYPLECAESLTCDAY